jgi:hypothetical protein
MRSEISHVEFRAAMKACDLLQKGVALMTGRTVGMVSNWATGRCPIPQYLVAILILANQDDVRSDTDDFSGDALTESFLLEWYEVLGLESTATLDEAKAARNSLAKLYHPDSKQSNFSNHRIMARISAAFQEAKTMLEENEDAAGDEISDVAMAIGSAA